MFLFDDYCVVVKVESRTLTINKDKKTYYHLGVILNLRRRVDISHNTQYTNIISYLETTNKQQLKD